MSAAADNLTIRYAKDQDYPFILSSMIKTLLRYSPPMSQVKASVLAEGVKKFVAVLWEDACVISVAALKDAPETIIGYVLAGSGSEPSIHFVYVKGAFRRMGIAEFMLEQQGITPRTKKYQFTHWTNRMGPITAKFKNLEYNPYAR